MQIHLLWGHPIHMELSEVHGVMYLKAVLNLLMVTKICFLSKVGEYCLSYSAWNDFIDPLHVVNFSLNVIINDDHQKLNYQLLKPLTYTFIFYF